MADKVTLDQVKRHLQVTSNDEDTYFQELIDRVSDWLNSYYGSNYWEVISVTSELHNGSVSSLYPENAPISNVVITDTDDSSIVDTDDYAVYPAHIMKKTGSFSIGLQRWQIAYDYGFLVAPLVAKQATLMLIGMLYNRADPTVKKEEIGDFVTTDWNLSFPKMVGSLMAKYSYRDC